MKKEGLFGIIEYIIRSKDKKMNFTSNFDKLSTPLMICSKEWKIVYKNRACKKHLPIPRCSSFINKYFLGDVSLVFPNEKSGITVVDFDIRGFYRSALCFEYRGYAVLLFSILLEYEAFCCNNERFFDSESADIMRNMFDALSDENIQNEDRYHRLEAIKRYIYGALENYLAFSLLCSKDKIVCPVERLYSLLKEKVMSIVPKAGYRIQIDIEDLSRFGEMYMADARTTSLVFANMVLFCMSVSKNKTCHTVVTMLGKTIHNKVYFSLENDGLIGKTYNGFDDFMLGKPAEYLNVLPFESMCNEFGWKIDFRVDEEEKFNACLSFDIDVDEFSEFKSPDVLSRKKDYAQTISHIVERILAVL